MDVAIGLHNLTLLASIRIITEACRVLRSSMDARPEVRYQTAVPYTGTNIPVYIMCSL